MIESRQLSKRYEDGVLALNALDLTVEPGTIYCLLGANGAGKTTAINLLLGLIEPDSGRALIHGIDIHRDPLAAKRWVGHVSENVQMYPNLTALQNLDFFFRLSGNDHVERDAYREVLLRVGLPEAAHAKKVKTFSKGMRQKLGIAVAVLKGAHALILDEPMSGLDPRAAAELVGTLHTLRQEGRAILLSTHDIFRAKEMADVVGIMREGVKVAELAHTELENVDLEGLYLDYMSKDS